MPRVPMGHRMKPTHTKSIRCEPSCCQPSLSSPLDEVQANDKPLVSSTHTEIATLAHGHEVPTRGHAEAMRSQHQSRSSKAGKALTMWTHGACFFSMIRTRVPDALVAMGCPAPMDFIMRRCASTSLPFGASLMAVGPPLGGSV